MTRTINRCEICLSESLRRVLSTAPGPRVAICDQCLTVFNLEDRSPDSCVCSIPSSNAVSAFRGYDAETFAGGPCDRLLRRYVSGRGTALDIGCFDGAFMAFLESRGFSAYGLELQPEMAAFCRKQGLSVSVGAFPFDIPTDIASRQYDLITALESAYYWENLDECAAEINRLLRNGGHFLVKLVQGTSSHYNGNRSYADRVSDFTIHLNVDALSILMARHGLSFVTSRAFAYIYDTRRHHPNPIARLWYRNWTRLKSLWAAAFWKPQKWDKVVVLFRKPG